MDIDFPKYKLQTEVWDSVVPILITLGMVRLFLFLIILWHGWDGLAAKMPSVQAWHSEEDPWGLQKAGRREST